jgi:hypothetical protein
VAYREIRGRAENAGEWTIERGAGRDDNGGRQVLCRGEYGASCVGGWKGTDCLQEEDFDYDAGLYDELNLQDEDVDYLLQEYNHADESLSNLDTASATDGGEPYNQEIHIALAWATG